jgi:hypothetical protein
MLKFLIVTLLAIQCNCQRVVEIGSGNGVRAVQVESRPVFSGLSSVRTIGGLSSFGVQPFGAAYGPAAYGVGLSSIGGLRLNYGNYGNYGLGQVAVRPHAVSYVAAQPAYQTVAVAQPAYQTVAVAQPQVQTVVQAVQPAVQTVAVAQPQVYSSAVQQVQHVQQQVPVVNAAVHQVGRTVEYRAVPFNDEPINPQVVEVEPADQPLHIHFKSRSSTIQLSQEHTGQPGTVEQTSSQDEPSKVIHEVVKPVIQEVREVVQPYRQLSQEIQPVIENVHTVVSRGEGERRQFVAQQYVPQAVQAVAVQPAVQHVQTVAVQPAVQHVQTVAHPYAVQHVRTVAQPVAQFQTVAQPYAVQQVAAQPYAVQQVRTVAAQPLLGLSQAYRQILSPAQSVYAVEQQPGVQVIGGGSLLNSGLFSSRQVGLGLGGALVNVRSQPIGAVSYSRTFTESDQQ